MYKKSIQIHKARRLRRSIGGLLNYTIIPGIKLKIVSVQIDEITIYNHQWEGGGGGKLKKNLERVS